MNEFVEEDLVRLETTIKLSPILPLVTGATGQIHLLLELDPAHVKLIRVRVKIFTGVGRVERKSLRTRARDPVGLPVRVAIVRRIDQNPSSSRLARTEEHFPGIDCDHRAQGLECVIHPGLRIRTPPRIGRVDFEEILFGEWHSVKFLLSSGRAGTCACRSSSAASFMDSETEAENHFMAGFEHCAIKYQKPSRLCAKWIRPWLGRAKGGTGGPPCDS